jgi:hypothetical protein
MRFIELINTETGEKVIVDTYESRYRRIAMGMLNRLRLKKKFIKHITLTQKEENYKPNHLNAFFVKMRRYYGDLVYMWTVEVQEERLEKTGEAVLHWHIMIGFDPGMWKGKEDVFRIQQYWKYGNVDIKPVKKANTAYLLKYVTKALNVRSEEFYQVRRIGSSRIAGWLKQSWQKVLNVLSYFSRVNIFEDGLSAFHWNRGRAYAEDEWGRKVEIYRPPPSPWKLLVKLGDETPF